MTNETEARRPGDTQLLAALEQLVQHEGVVEAGNRLGVNYRTVVNCRDSGHVSRKMRDVLEQFLREHPEQASSAEPAPDKGQERRLQELEQGQRELQAQLESLRAWVDADERWNGRGLEQGETAVNGDGANAGGGDRQRPVAYTPRRVFPELITELAEPGEEQIYGAATAVIVEWRTAWAERWSARHTLDWLRADRRRLELELRLIGKLGLTPPPADVPWTERRRERELRWRRGSLRRLRWQLPLTRLLHGLLRGLTLGLWGH